MSSGFFRGTTSDQDARFGNAEKKLMKKLTFAKVLSTKVRREIDDVMHDDDNDGSRP